MPGTAEQAKRAKEPVAFRDMYGHLARRKDGEEKRAILLMGEPGSGKTTAGLQLFWLLASRFRVPGLPEDCAPVWLAFRALEGKSINSLQEFLGMEADDAPGLEGAAQALLACKRPLLWILDGFDEIPSTRLQTKIGNWILDLKAKRRQDRFLVTSRYLGGRKILEKLADFQLRPLDKEAQEQFIANYLKHGGIAEVEAHTAELIEIIEEKERHSGEERRMARNPMLLSLICFLFAEDVKEEENGSAAADGRKKNLPDDWDDLYEKFLEEFLNRGLERLGGEEGDYGLWNPCHELTVLIAFRVLQQLAWWMQGQKDRVSQPAESLDSARGRRIAHFGG